MANFEGFKLLCNNCGNDDQNYIETYGDYNGIVHLKCRVCEHESEDRKYSWQES